MKKTIAIVYASALLNLCGTSWVIGAIGFGWGTELLGDKLGLILWGLFLNSIVLAFSLLMIAMVSIIGRRINKQEQLIKRYEKKQANADDLSRSFLEESWRRDIDKLKREEMKEFMVHFLLMSEQLSEHIEILVGRKPEYIKLIEESIKSLSTRRDNQRDNPKSLIDKGLREK